MAEPTFTLDQIAARIAHHMGAATEKTPGMKEFTQKTPEEQAKELENISKVVEKMKELRGSHEANLALLDKQNDLINKQLNWTS